MQISPAQKTRVAMLREFLQGEATGGYILMFTAALALVIANSPLAPSYFALLETKAGFALGPLVLKETVLHWINDGLMAIFFLLVGLEIKREMLDGQLKGASRIALPAIAAFGGMLVPALIYYFFNSGNPDTIRGWAIPSATDIAFALGVLALLGNRVPTSLKVFLTALAILDDLGAIVIIAIGYTENLHLGALGISGALLLVLAVMNRLGVMRLLPYLVAGTVLWYFVLESGIHATLAGVLLALAIPLRPKRGGDIDQASSPLYRLEHLLHKPVAFVIVPVFGLANAGVSFAGMGLSSLLEPVPLGIAFGLFTGKQIGVFGFTMIAVKLRIVSMPLHASLLQLYGVALLCGIGFTMSLFIGALAFTDPATINATKIGVMSGSLLSALSGYLMLRVARPLPVSGHGTTLRTAS